MDIETCLENPDLMKNPAGRGMQEVLPLLGGLFTWHCLRFGSHLLLPSPSPGSEGREVPRDSSRLDPAPPVTSLSCHLPLLCPCVPPPRSFILIYPPLLGDRCFVLFASWFSLFSPRIFPHLLSLLLIFPTLGDAPTAPAREGKVTPVSCLFCSSSPGNVGFQGNMNKSLLASPRACSQRGQGLKQRRFPFNLPN